MGSPGRSEKSTRMTRMFLRPVVQGEGGLGGGAGAPGEGAGPELLWRISEAERVGVGISPVSAASSFLPILSNSCREPKRTILPPTSPRISVDTEGFLRSITFRAL